MCVRLASAVFINVVIGLEQPVFSDVHIYDRLADQRASGAYREWDTSSEFYYDRFATFVVPLSILYRLFGSFLFLGQVLAAVAGTLTAVLTCKLLLMVTAKQWAILGGLIIAVFPSQVVWSSTGFRDSFVWMVTAALAVVCAFAARAFGWRLLGLGVAAVALVFALGHLRLSTMIVASWALMFVAIFSVEQQRLVRAVGALVIALIVPWYIGTGLGGLEYITNQSPAELRADRALGADSAFVEESVGEVRSDLAHLPRGLSVMLFEPWPGTSFTGSSVRLAQVELVMWYPLLLLAVLGVPEAFRSRRVLTFSAVTGGTLLMVYALSEGNFGTAFRHRAELVPPMTVLAVLGAAALTERRRRHEQERDEPQMTV